MGDGGRKGQTDTVTQRQAQQLQPQGAILHCESVRLLVKPQYDDQW